MLKSTANESNQDDWTLVVKPQTPWWDLRLKDVWNYRDLLWLFVRRDFVSIYKQTILGPLWFFIQPLLTMIMFVIIFSGVARIPTDGLPPSLFYLAGMTPWNFFAACLTSTSTTFISNASLFGKVYFPRLVVPLSIVISNLIQFLIQFVLFAGFYAWSIATGSDLRPSFLLIVLLTPLLLVVMGLLGLGAGIMVSAVTTKYRDLARLVSFGIQLMMYATPVIYPVSAIPDKYKWLIQLNPMTSIIETFRAIFLGGDVPWGGLLVSGLVTLAVLLVGIVLFNKVEKTFVDTV
jgi:lipopolysaccharide transport system permease protein